MITDSTPKTSKPAGSANSTAGGTDHQIFPGKRANDNFQCLKDRFALQERRPYPSDPADGRIGHFVESMGLIELVISLDQAIDRLRALGAR
jgi:hypothetical protein